MNWFIIRPLSAVSIRDGRKFDAGDQTMAATVFPKPSTTAGALAAAFKGDFESAIGPFPCRHRGPDEQPELLFPIPRDLMIDENGRVDRPELNSNSDVFTDAPVSGLLHGNGTMANGWLTTSGLTRYLDGQVPRRLVNDPWSLETRVGLWRKNGRTAEDKYLYSNQNMVFNDDVVLSCFVVGGGLPNGGSQLVRFGGEARLAEVSQISSVSNLPPELPPRPTAIEGGRVLLYLATPGIFPNGWLPPLPERVKVVAAAVGSPEPVAMLGLAKTGTYARHRIRSLVRAAPAGSVYYLQFDDPAEALEWSDGVHGSAVRFKDDADLDRLSTAGFNVVFTGSWK